MKHLKSFIKALAVILVLWGAAALLGGAVNAAEQLPAWTLIVLFGAGIFLSAKAMMKFSR